MKAGTLTLEETATGYIIRDETVVQGKNYKNGIYPIVAEGERAAKNQTIFRYYGKNEEEIQEKISQIDLKIQTALEKEDTRFPTDVKNLEEQIDSKIQILKTSTDINTITEYKKELSDIILKKATIAGENSKQGSYIKKLVNQREQYEKKLIEGSEYMKATKSGIVSYRVDGLEKVLTTKNFDSLTAEQLEELDVKTGKIVSTSNESAKVIDNFGCYIATVLDSDVAKDAKEGQNVKITLASGDEITATINTIKEQDDGRMLIILKLSTLTEELTTYRKISFNITWWSVSGIKVPNDAIMEGKNNSKYVVKKTNTGTTECLIKILKTNDRYSIIGAYSTEDLQALGVDVSTYKGIEIYDTIMLYPNQQ